MHNFQGEKIIKMSVAYLVCIKHIKDKVSKFTRITIRKELFVYRLKFLKNKNKTLHDSLVIHYIGIYNSWHSQSWLLTFVRGHSQSWLLTFVRGHSQSWLLTFVRGNCIPVKRFFFNFEQFLYQCYRLNLHNC